MGLRFLTPLGAVFALAVLLPVAVLLLRERRARAVRAALGLAQPRLLRLTAPVLALALLVGLLALAAAQPVLETTRTIRERTDAEVFVLVDTSRSMLAATGPDEPTRLERIRVAAEELRAQLPEVPVGVLSLTDRVLPHLFPTVDGAVFRSTIERSIGIERPPPSIFFSTRATDLNTLGGIPKRGFYSPSARKRVLVVYTDGESQPLQPGLQEAFQRRPRIETVLVHVWGRGERIYETGTAERAYTPDPASAASLDDVASLVGGVVLPESASAEAGRRAAELLGTGPTRARVLEGERRALMPWVVLLAVLPLGFLLYRRNL